MENGNIQSDLNKVLKVEQDLRNEYNCDRFGIGGIADSDHLKRVGWYYGMAMVLVKYYNDKNEESIDNFLQKYFGVSPW